ncbi:replicative DNA helicase [Rubritalea marina]|uniref:replicative DNA helicase n=1 Tax=Rubritalea marina TaxID=361055 RepID=UPI00036AADB7|nr:replicative DNA helicase [Rubritalea marina]
MQTEQYKTNKTPYQKNSNEPPELLKAPRMDDVEAMAARSLPNAIGPEKSLLSSMLQDPAEYVMKAEEMGLTPEHLYHPSHQTLYRVIKEISDGSGAIELVSLTQKLMDQGVLENIGGAAALTEIYTYAPTAAHFEHHLGIVKDKYILRNVISSCTEAITRSFEDQEEVASLLDEVEQKIFAIREGADIEQAPTVKEDIKKVLDNFEQFLADGGAPMGIKSGYNQLDTMCNGLKSGEMFVIAARPSMGKTSFVMNIIEHICLDAKMPSMFFSCEMTSEQIVQRLLFARARYAITNLRNGFKPTKSDLLRIKNAAEEIATSKLFIDDTAGISISELRAKARRKKKEEDIQVIAIDYLQLMKSTSKQAQNSREREIAEISAGLKALAKELGIPIIVLAQLNRGPENRGGTPKMSDLRESGSIEQDADMIGLLYRTAYYAEDQEQRDADDGIAELNLAKNRNGPTGSIPLTFIKELMRFETRSFESEPE